MKTRIILMACAATLLLPVLGLAHGGHGLMEGWELAHYLTSAMHAGPVMVLAALLIFVVRHECRPVFSIDQH